MTYTEPKSESGRFTDAHYVYSGLQIIKFVGLAGVSCPLVSGGQIG